MKIEIKTKIKTDSPEILSRVYTPGVGECCIEIKKDPQKLVELTNYANSIAVPGFERDKANVEQTVLKYIKKGIFCSGCNQCDFSCFHKLQQRLLLLSIEVLNFVQIE